MASVLYRHGYFYGRGCRSFQLSIPSATEVRLRNLNAVVKPFSSGFYLLSSTPDLFKEEWSPLPFHLSLADPFFWNYTDFPITDPGNTALYFNNLTTDQSNQDGLSLHASAFAGKDSLLDIHAGQLPFKIFGGREKIIVRDVKGEILAKTTGPIHGFKPDYDGYYLLEGEELSKTCYYFSNAVFRKPLGIIELFPALIYDSKADSEAPAYNLTFRERETRWRYLLADPFYAKYNNLIILDTKKKEPVFEEKELYLDGIGKIRCLESLEGQPFTNYYSGHLLLMDNTGPNHRTGNIVIKNLPGASPAMLYQDKASPETYYSHIFI